MTSANHLYPARVAHLPNGVELAYEQAGTGKPLVFIHGGMGDWRSWDRQWSAFTSEYACVSYSRRYSYPNRNTMPSPHHSAVDEATDLSLFLDYLGWDKAILVGSSYGAFTALALAALAPNRCMALALSEPPMLKYAELSEAGRHAAAVFRREIIEPANEAFKRGDDEKGAIIMTGGINGSNGVAMSPTAYANRMQNLQAMRILALSTDEFPWIEPRVLGSLPMPVMLMAGRNTMPIHAETFRNLCAAMPQAAIHWIENSGHSVSREQPEAFNQLVKSFLVCCGFSANMCASVNDA
jgi:pimeloyl-ACP methyl ester carboxylesterase